MNNNDNWVQAEINRYRSKLIGHGALVLVIGLIGGLMLLFSMLNGFIIWPFLDIPFEIPGSIRGWKAAHVGGITNGLLIIGVAFVLTKISISISAARFVFWSMILTGWGNTLFYWGGNFSPSRGISVLENQYGESNVAGLIAFVGGGSAMLFTILAMCVVAQCAFRSATIYSDTNNTD